MATYYDPATGQYSADSQEELAALGPQAPQQSGMIRRTLGDAATSLAKGTFSGIPQAVIGLANIATLGLASKPLGYLGDQAAEMGEKIDKYYSPEHQAKAQEVANTKGFFPTLGAYLSNPGYLTDAVVEQLPSMVAGGVLGRAALGGKGALAAAEAAGGDAAVAAKALQMGAVGEGLITAGQNTEQIRQETPDRELSLGQLAAGAASGAVTGAISFGAGRLAQKMGITDADTFLAGGRRSIQDSPDGLLKRMGKGFLSEGVLEELPQSMQEQMWTNAALDNPLTQGVAEAGAAGLALGGAMGAGFAAKLNTNKQKDALAGIQILSQPVQPNDDGTFSVTPEHDAALRAMAAYARSVAPREEWQAIADWESAQQLALSKTGTMSFDGLPGVVSDESAKAWAQSRIAAMDSQMQGTADTTTNVVDDFGNLISSSVVPSGNPGRMLSKQERVLYDKLQQALDSGDVQEVARLQGKLAYTNPQAVPPAPPATATAAPPSAPPVTTPAAPTYKPTDPRGWDDAKLKAEAANLASTDASKLATDIRKEFGRRQEANSTYQPTAAMPDKITRTYGLRAVQREDGGAFSTKTTNELNQRIGDAFPKGGTLSQLVDFLNTFAADNAGAASNLAELASVYATRLNSKMETANVQTPTVNQGAGPVTGNTQSNAVVPGATSETSAQGDATGKPAEEAAKEKEVKPFPPAPPPLPEGNVIPDTTPSQGGQNGLQEKTAEEVKAAETKKQEEKTPPAPEFKVGDRVVTEHNKRGSVENVAANGNVHVMLEDGTKIAYPAKSVADGQLRPAAASSTPSEKNDKPAPKREVVPTAADWDNAYAAAKAQADKLGLVLPENGAANPAEAAEALKALTQKIAKIEDEGTRTQMRALVAKARDAATVEMARRKAQFEADMKAKDERNAAEATKKLQETPDLGRLLSPEAHWNALRNEAAQKAGVSPEGFYIPTYDELTDKARTAWEKGDRQKADFKAAVDATQQDRAAEKAKQVNSMAADFLSNSAKAYSRFLQMMALANMMLKLEGHNTKGNISLMVDGQPSTMTHAQAVGYVVGEYNKFLRTATNQSAPVRTLAEMRDRLGAELAEITPTHTAEEYRAMSIEQLRGEVTQGQQDIARAVAKYLRANPSEMSNTQKELLQSKMDLLKELGAKLKDKDGKPFVPKGSWTFKDSVETFEFLSIAAGNTNPALEVALMETNGSTRLAEVLQSILKLSGNEPLRALAQHALNLGVSGITIKYEPKLMQGTHPSGKRAWKRGAYDAKDNSITIFKGGENSHIILHEVVHALTARNIDRAAKMEAAGGQQQAQMRKGYLQLVELYSALKEMPQFAGEYAFKNLHEFVAEVHSNPELQKKLAATPAPKGMFGIVAKLGNMMQAFVESIRNILNLKPGSTDALTAALTLSAQFIEGNTKAAPQKSSGSFDALSSPSVAVNAPFQRLQTFLPQYDNWLGKVNMDTALAKLRKAKLYITSTDYIRDMVDKSPVLKSLAGIIGKWFDVDQKKSQAKSLVSKDVFDNFLRPLILELQKSGKYELMNELMGRLAGEASILHIDLSKDFDQNNLDRKAKKMKPLPEDKRISVNKLNQQFKALQSGPNKNIAKMLVQGEKVNRKLLAMSVASLVRSTLEEHAQGGRDTAQAAQDLLNKYGAALDILNEKGRTNTNPALHLDELSASIHDALAAIHTAATQGAIPHGDLVDDIRAITKQYMKAWDAPYMHLGRHGLYSVAFKAVDQTHQTAEKLNKLLGKFGITFDPLVTGNAGRDVFIRVETISEMKEIESLLKANKSLVANEEYEDEKGVKKTRSTLAAGAISEVGVDNMHGVGRAMMKLRDNLTSQFDELRKANNGQNPHLKAAYDDMRAMLTKAFLDMLEVNSAHQVTQQRKGTAGYSLDYVQNFAKRAQWADASIANLYTARDYSRAFKAMQDAIDNAKRTDSMESIRGQEIYDELATRFSNSLKPNTSPITQKLSAFGHNFYLALSPAYTVGNLTQPYVITLPLLGARFGFVKAAKAMSRASYDAGRLVKASIKSGWAEGGWLGLLEANIDPTKIGMTKDEVDFIRHLIRSGIVDATQAQELGRLAKGETSFAATAAKTMTVFNHYSEVLNRISAGLAAYRLAQAEPKKVDLSNAGSKDKALKYAIDIVTRTQYNYAEHNKARAIGRNGFMGEATPLFMQFQNFAFFTMENYIRMFRDGFINKSLPESERAVAKKALAATLGTVAVMAGTMGLPFATVAAALANAADDDDKDARARYRIWLAGIFGEKGAEIIAKGPLSHGVLGVDLTGSLGHQDLLPMSRFMADRRAWEDKVKNQTGVMFGPALNAGFDILGGVSKLRDGDLWGGWHQILPRALKGPLDAVHTSKEGAFTNKSGTTLPLPVEWSDYAKMGLGFTPSRKAEQSEANFFYQSELTQRKQDKTKAKKAYERAMEEGDIDGAIGSVAEYNLNHLSNPLRNLGSVVAAKARGQAMAIASDTGIIEGNKKHFPLLAPYAAWGATE